MVLLLAGSFALVFFGPPFPTTRGQLTALYDVARGQYKILGYGLPAPSRPLYVRILKENYGIEYHAVAGCMVSYSLKNFVRGYDQVSEAAANRKFGRDVIQESSDEADRRWKQTRLWEETNLQETDYRFGRSLRRGAQ
jgi:hypothetical protein